MSIPRDPAAPPPPPTAPDPARLYGVLAASAPDAIVTIDAASTILTVNPAVERLFGYAAAELIGRPLSVLMPERMRQSHHAGMGRYLGTGVRRIGWQGVRLPALTKGGAEIPVEISFGEFEADGRRLFSGFIRDVSDRVAAEHAVDEARAAERDARAHAEARAREAEQLAEQLQAQAAELEVQTEELQASATDLAERTDAAERALSALAESEARFRAVHDASPSGFALQRPIRDSDRPNGAAVDFEITYVNAAGARLLGRTREEMLGRRHLALFPAAAAGGSFAVYARVADSGEPFQGEVVYRLDGLDRGFALTVVRVGGDVAVTFTDVSERLRAATERDQLLAAERAARAEAEAANRAKAEFLATMSHELRTPLNAIGGYAELLEMGIRGPVTAQQVEDLRRVQASQRHLLGLVNEVLNYARIETGTVRYDVDDVSLSAVVASVEPLVDPQLAAKRLAYTVEACDPAPIARADRDKVRQVLLNLLSNAIKFTAPGGRVGVACGGEAGRVTVRVRDTGIGIAASELQHIFEPFVQVNASLTRQYEGTGLGLAISRDLARGMGGDLTVESEPGVGSTFTLALPRA